MSGCATRNDQLRTRYEMLQSLHNLITAFMLLANSTHKYIDEYDVSSVKVRVGGGGRCMPLYN